VGKKGTAGFEIAQGMADVLTFGQSRKQRQEGEARAKAKMAQRRTEFEARLALFNERRKKEMVDLQASDAALNGGDAVDTGSEKINSIDLLNPFAQSRYRRILGGNAENTSVNVDFLGL